MTGPTEASVPTIDARVEFWSGAGAQWPRSWYKHLFAGEVVHRTGRLMFGSEWTGTEPETMLIFPLPNRLDSSTRPDEIRWAIWLLTRYHKVYHDRRIEAASQKDAPPLPLPDEWLFAFGFAQQISNDAWASVSRFRSVINLLVGLLERGILRAALRPFSHGEPQELPAGSWYNEHYHAWFETCQIDVERPFSGVPIRTGGHWIIFDQASFVAWETDMQLAVAGQRCAENDASSVERAPPDVADLNAGGKENSSNSHRDNSSPEAANESGQCVGLESTVRSAAKVRAKRRPGAKPKYPWDDDRFETEINRLMSSIERPASLHQTADLMLEWCLCEWGREPGKSTMRKRVADILARNGFNFP